MKLIKRYLRRKYKLMFIPSKRKYKKKLEIGLSIYEVVFGVENGPNGFFISFFGLNETIELINNK